MIPAGVVVGVPAYVGGGGDGRVSCLGWIGVWWRCCPASCPAKVPVVTCKLALVAGFELWTGTQTEVGSNLASEVVRIFHQSCWVGLVGAWVVSWVWSVCCCGVC